MIQIPALASLSVGQKIAGAVLSVAIWLAPAGAVWLYMSGKISAAEQLGRAECAAETAGKLADGWKDALDKLEQTQERLDERAKKDAATLAADLARAQARADQMIEEFSDYAKAHPLDAGCRADPGRVRRVNEGRRPRPD